jgi:hypothetical protein
MILKFITEDGAERFYECNRVIVGGYTGSSEPGTLTIKSIHLECNDERGSMTTGFTSKDQVYILNNDGKTIDRVWF